jgi:glycosyltransferase involved in cell wall biosynthesis
MARRLQILAPTRYPWRFNGPRQSRHDIEVRNFLPLNKVASAIEGITVFDPLPPRRSDLVHGFNRIPLGRTPFIIGFESHLPRAFGWQDSKFFHWMTQMLASPRCRRIVAISEYAKRQFIQQHAGLPELDDLLAKLEVRYPNIGLSPLVIDNEKGEQTLRLLFVGNHFARKGGCVALRLAEIAQQQGLPVQIDIVSSFETGSWVDPTRPAFFEAERALLASLPNVTHYGALPNEHVLRLIEAAHFLLLPTFSDTFGYSAIEAMARGVPVIGTDQAALPEFIRDGENGILLPLEKNAVGEWRHVARRDRGSVAYEEFFRLEVDRLADAAFTQIQKVFGTPSYAAMRHNARITAEQLFDAAAANKYWDDLYEQA